MKPNCCTTVIKTRWNWRKTRMPLYRFSLISTGFRYPKEPAIHIAISAINEFLDTHEMEVYLTIYDEQTLMLAEGFSPPLLIDDRWGRSFLSTFSKVDKKDRPICIKGVYC